MAHPLCGADPATLIRVLADAGRPDHWRRAAAIGASVLGRMPASGLEYLLTAARAVRAARAMPPPIFILGHWRSGTTHLYNLMAGAGFGYVPPVAVGLPWDQAGIARLLRPVLERALPEHRWIDRMAVTPSSPQEDEIALASMSELSFYHGIYFPQHFDRLIDRGVFLDGATEAQIARWEHRLALFYGKLYRAQGVRLMIKNPVYTARVAQLRRLFPGAKFVHIHRSPQQVFASMRNFYARLLEVMALQLVPGDLDLDATILRVFDRMMDRLVRDVAELAPPDFVELGYHDLTGDPIGALRQIYEGLELPGFAAAEPGFRNHLAAVKDYRRNRFDPDPAADALVEEKLGRWIDRWGYSAE